MVDSDHEIDAGVLVFQRLSQAAPQGTPLVDLVLWTICEVTLRHEPHNDGSELNRYDAIDGTALRRATHREHPATATGSLASSRSCRSSQQGTASLPTDMYEDAAPDRSRWNGWMLKSISDEIAMEGIPKDQRKMSGT